MRTYIYYSFVNNTADKDTNAVPALRNSLFKYDWEKRFSSEFKTVDTGIIQRKKATPKKLLWSTQYSIATTRWRLDHHQIQPTYSRRWNRSLQPEFEILFFYISDTIVTSKFMKNLLNYMTYNLSEQSQANVTKKLTKSCGFLQLDDKPESQNLTWQNAYQ